MTCACGYAAPPEFAFCPRCGGKLSASCPACGTPSSADFAFCPRCGTALRAGLPAGEPAPEVSGDRRMVTVLFADLSEFTGLGERLDPEHVRALQTELFATLSASIEQYGGFVEKYVGDAVLAVFGAPVAHENDPERAVRAALAMRQRMEGLDRAWRPRLGRPLRLHIGVHTGPVVAGILGAAGQSAYAVTGDTVNTAARLQSAAEPGEIVVSAVTQRVTQHLFAFEPREPLRLKGKSEGVGAYRVRGLLAHRGAMRGLESHGLSAPLVGRDDELGQLLAAWARARRGRSQVVSLVGEAGQGKSRLLTELLARLGDDGAAGAAVRRVACSALGEQTYGVFAGFLREAYGIGPDDPPDLARAKLAEGARGIGAGPDPTALVEPMLACILGLDAHGLKDLEPEALRRQIFGAARALLERRLQQGPLVLAVEDLHWADAASVELLRHLVDRLPDRPLLLVLTYRPSVQSHALVTTRAPHTAIRLAPLSTGEVERLLGAYFGPAVRDWPPELCALIVARAGGNPLFLEEIVRSLIATGRLRQTGRGWACRGGCENLDLPPTIQGLLAARLDHVAPPARRLLQEAAVLGPTFDADILRRVTSTPAAVEAMLDVLLEGELVEELPAPGEEAVRRFRFSHTLLHEVAYENLLLSRRTELHGAIARTLEQLWGRDPRRLEDLEALAHHFSRSAARPKAAEYLVKAGDRARSVYANEDAVRHYRQALAALQECEACDAEILVVHERLGDLLGPMGHRDAAREHYEAVRAGGQAAGRPAAAARLLRKIGGLHWEAGEREAALACFQAGLGLIDGAPDEIERAHLHQELGRCAFRSGDHQAAMQWAERALADAERLIDSGVADSREAAAAVAHACNTLGIALARLHRPDDAVSCLERSVSVAESHGLPQAAGRGYTNLGVLYTVLDARRGIETCGRGLDIARKIGDFGLQSRLYANLAVAYCALNDRCEQQGIEAAEASITLDRQLDQRDHLAVPLIVLGQIYQCHGEPDRALAYYREALALAEEAGEPQLLFPCYDGLATLHLDRGDDTGAERYFVQAQAVCERSGLNPDDLIVLPFLS